MAFVKQGMTALGAALLLGSGLAAAPAQAGYTVTLLQQGTNVVATGSGTINLTDLTDVGAAASNSGFLSPNLGRISTAPTTTFPDLLSLYDGATGPTSFGSGGLTTANSGTGDAVGLQVIEPPTEAIIGLPEGYVSGHALSDTSTYDNMNFSMLGVTPGTYTWTWGTGANADSFTLQIGPAAVPETSTIALLALPLGLVMWLTARRTRPAPGIR